MSDNPDDRLQLSPLALAVFQKMREHWTKDLADALRQIDPYATQGRLTAKSLPPNVLRDTGDYSPSAVYRKGDVVTGTDGRDYYVTVDRTTGLEPSANPANFRPVEGWNPAHTHDGGDEEGVPLDALYTHEHVILGPATGAIHWSRDAILALVGSVEPFGIVFNSEGSVVLDETGAIVTHVNP